VTEAVRALLIEDHAVVRAGCRVLLQRRPNFELVEAPSGSEGLAMNAQLKPALVILDIGLPDGSGLNVIPDLRSANPDVRILVFSMHADPVFAARSVECGADGYVSKNDAPEVLLDAIDAILKGDVYLSRSMAQRMALMEIQVGDHPLKNLTGRELEVLRLVGAGKSLAEIADDLQIGYRTVANVVTHLKRKLNVNTTSKLLRIAMDIAQDRR